jgi:hypothetical protein
MRNLVEPPPSTHCERCGGELLFKDLETDDPALDIEVRYSFAQNAVAGTHVS